ncbi:hypothetical protein L1987_08953 [Smallanthus sonchifolius]|uniref:Uncharacterized protein n=1 Tax=Smallanthus sonchifolius TaxID=185202 RepID=A0ACB9JNT1_9ASTR|nr:hypothetical protein L1987_08953 [Smallanthus sonchifolius]
MAEVDINNPNDKFSTYHNLTTYLVKGKKSERFDDIIDFLCRSKIHFALTVDGKDITVTEDTLRKHLKLQDEGDAILYTKDEYMRTFKRIGWHQVSSAFGSAVHGMITGQDFNFAHLIFEGLRYNLQEGAKQAFFMYPRVNVPLLSAMLNIQVTQGDSSAAPADTDPTPSTSQPEHTSASLDRTLVQPIKDAQAQQILTSVLEAQLENRAPVEASYTRKRKRSKKTPSILVSQAQSNPKALIQNHNTLMRIP